MLRLGSLEHLEIIGNNEDAMLEPDDLSFAAEFVLALKDCRLTALTLLNVCLWLDNKGAYVVDAVTRHPTLRGAGGFSHCGA